MSSHGAPTGKSGRIAMLLLYGPPDPALVQSPWLYVSDAQVLIIGFVTEFQTLLIV
jgi:hypothetical protein